MATGGDAELAARLVAQLREAREARGMSMQALAQSAGLHRTAIGLIERGQRRMTIEVAARIAWAMDLSLTELISVAEGGGDEPRPVTAPSLRS